MLHCFTLQIGIIGGSGMDDPDILENRQEKCVSTPYGEVCLYNVNDIYSPHCDLLLYRNSLNCREQGWHNGESTVAWVLFLDSA